MSSTIECRYGNRPADGVAAYRSDAAYRCAYCGFCVCCGCFADARNVALRAAAATTTVSEAATAAARDANANATAATAAGVAAPEDAATAPRPIVTPPNPWVLPPLAAWPEATSCPQCAQKSATLELLPSPPFPWVCESWVGEAFRNTRNAKTKAPGGGFSHPSASAAYHRVRAEFARRHRTTAVAGRVPRISACFLGTVHSCAAPRKLGEPRLVAGAPSVTLTRAAPAPAGAVPVPGGMDETAIAAASSTMAGDAADEAIDVDLSPPGATATSMSTTAQPASHDAPPQLSADAIVATAITETATTASSTTEAQHARAPQAQQHETEASAAAAARARALPTSYVLNPVMLGRLDHDAGAASRRCREDDEWQHDVPFICAVPHVRAPYFNVRGIAADLCVRSVAAARVHVSSRGACCSEGDCFAYYLHNMDGLATEAWWFGVRGRVDVAVAPCREQLEDVVPVARVVAPPSALASVRPMILQVPRNCGFCELRLMQGTRVAAEGERGMLGRGLGDGDGDGDGDEDDGDHNGGGSTTARREAIVLDMPPLLTVTVMLDIAVAASAHQQQPQQSGTAAAAAAPATTQSDAAAGVDSALQLLGGASSPLPSYAVLPPPSVGERVAAPSSSSSATLDAARPPPPPPPPAAAALHSATHHETQSVRLAVHLLLGGTNVALWGLGSKRHLLSAIARASPLASFAVHVLDGTHFRDAGGASSRLQERGLLLHHVDALRRNLQRFDAEHWHSLAHREARAAKVRARRLVRLAGGRMIGMGVVAPASAMHTPVGKGWAAAVAARGGGCARAATATVAPAAATATVAPAAAAAAAAAAATATASASAAAVGGGASGDGDASRAEAIGGKMGAAPSARPAGAVLATGRGAGAAAGGVGLGAGGVITGRAAHHRHLPQGVTPFCHPLLSTPMTGAGGGGGAAGYSTVGRRRAPRAAADVTPDSATVQFVDWSMEAENMIDLLLLQPKLLPPPAHQHHNRGNASSGSHDALASPRFENALPSLDPLLGRIGIGSLSDDTLRRVFGDLAVAADAAVPELVMAATASAAPATTANSLNNLASLPPPPLRHLVVLFNVDWAPSHLLARVAELVAGRAGRVVVLCCFDDALFLRRAEAAFASSLRLRLIEVHTMAPYVVEGSAVPDMFTKLVDAVGALSPAESSGMDDDDEDDGDGAGGGGGGAGAASRGRKGARRGGAAVHKAAAGSVPVALREGIVRAITSFPAVYWPIINALAAHQVAVGAAQFVGVNALVDVLERAGLATNPQRLRHIQLELTSNQIAQYDSTTHSMRLLYPEFLAQLTKPDAPK